MRRLGTYALKNSLYIQDSVYTRLEEHGKWMHSEKEEGEEMEASCHRHDISGKVRALVEPHLPGQRGQWEGIAQDNRRFINAVFGVLRTGAPGVTCRQIMGNGAVFTNASSGGAKADACFKKGDTRCVSPFLALWYFSSKVP